MVLTWLVYRCDLRRMPVDLKAIGRKLGAVTHSYEERDVMLYALGVGCGTDDLQFTYGRDLKVLPTFAGRLDEAVPLDAVTAFARKRPERRELVVLESGHELTDVLEPMWARTVAFLRRVRAL